MNTTTVSIVLMNGDFTEGRGPMSFHKAFHTFEKAEEYVKKQSGIMGTEQCDKPSYVSGNSYSYNGYRILKDVEVL